jgi:hypothetical protein
MFSRHRQISPISRVCYFASTVENGTATYIYFRFSEAAVKFRRLQIAVSTFKSVLQTLLIGILQNILVKTPK